MRKIYILALIVSAVLFLSSCFDNNPPAGTFADDKIILIINN